MSTIPRDIVAKKGQKILPRWKALLRFIKSTGVIAGKGVKISRGPNGTTVSADHFQKPWSHPFKVTVSGGSATIRMGTVNGLVPHIDGVNISGFDDDFKQVNVPSIPIEPGEEGESHIALVLNVPDGSSAIILDDPATFTIEHFPWASDVTGGGGEDYRGAGKYPLAVLLWGDDGKLIKKHQVVHFNLGHRFLQSEAASGRPSRHLFWAV